MRDSKRHRSSRPIILCLASIRFLFSFSKHPSLLPRLTFPTSPSPLHSSLLVPSLLADLSLIVFRHSETNKLLGERGSEIKLILRFDFPRSRSSSTVHSSLHFLLTYSLNHHHASYRRHLSRKCRGSTSLNSSTVSGSNPRQGQSSCTQPR